MFPTPFCRLLLTSALSWPDSQGRQEQLGHCWVLLINPFWPHSPVPLHPLTSCSSDGSFCLCGSPSARADRYCAAGLLTTGPSSPTPMQQVPTPQPLKSWRRQRMKASASKVLRWDKVSSLRNSPYAYCSPHPMLSMTTQQIYTE